MSGSALKVIAVISMVIDHSAYYLMEHETLLYEVMRCFGRIAFPVFAFLIAEGFQHTRNRIKYFLQLLGFAVVSEVPWYLLNGADGTHNVLFTRKHSKKCTFYTLRFGCSFAAVNTIKPQLL